MRSKKEKVKARSSYHRKQNPLSPSAMSEVRKVLSDSIPAKAKLIRLMDHWLEMEDFERGWVLSHIPFDMDEPGLDILLETLGDETIVKAYQEENKSIIEAIESAIKSKTFRVKSPIYFLDLEGEESVGFPPYESVKEDEDEQRERLFEKYSGKRINFHREGDKAEIGFWNLSDSSIALHFLGKSSISEQTRARRGLSVKILPLKIHDILANKTFWSNSLFERVELLNSDFEKSVMHGFSIQESTVKNCSFKGSRFFSGSFENLTEDQDFAFNQCNFEECLFLGRWSKNRTTIEGRGRRQRTRGLTPFDFVYYTFRDTSFKNSVFQNVQMEGISFEGCDFRGTRFPLLQIDGEDINSSILDSRFTECDFSGADLSWLSLRGCSFENCKYDKETKFPDEIWNQWS